MTKTKLYEVSTVLSFSSQEAATAFINRRSWRKGATLKRISMTIVEDRRGIDGDEDEDRR